MARDNDETARAYSMGTVTIEGRLGGDIRNISKDDSRPTIAATVFGNSTKWNGFKESLKFNVIVNGPRAKAIWENKDDYTKGSDVMAGGELFAAEEYNDEIQMEIAGWGAWINPNHKWAENSGSGGGRSSRRDDDDDDDDSGSSRRSGRSSSRRSRDDDDDDSSSRSSSRRSSRRGGDDEEESSSRGGRSDRSSRRRRVQEEGDGDDD
jgi:hypothetical protein